MSEPPRQSRRRVAVASREEPEAAAAGWTAGQSSSAIDVQLKLIESPKATERAQGIQQLAEVLREDGLGAQVLAASLSSSTWEQVITWTARILIKESQNYVNRHGSEWPQLSAAAERLRSKIQTQYSGHIRHIWIAAMPHLPEKLARFLTKHIVESIDESPCLAGVLGTDFAKALRAWAAHEPHVLGCRDGRAEAIVDMCIQWLSSRISSSGGGTAESQMSVDSVSDLGVAPGDVEYAMTLLAIMTAASPARLARLGDRVLGFCAEYCRYYHRENACFTAILDTVNVILLATADEQVVGHAERIRSLLSCSLRLWPSRSVHVKHSALYSIRILTRLAAHVLRDSHESDVHALMELALKSLTSGPWDKFKFMLLPSSLQSTWPLVRGQSRDSSAKASLSPRERLAMLWPMIEPNQMAFFDTVSFLVATLTARSVSAESASVQGRRKKKARLAPTPLSRLLTTMGSDDSAASSSGAAQVVWFIVNFYSDKLGHAQCLELLHDIQALLQSSDMSQNGDLAQWTLGIYYSLAHLETLDRELGAAVHATFDSLWKQAIAGLEAGLAGAAALVCYMLHRCSGSGTDVCLLCQQAADALALCPSKHAADVTQLTLLLSPSSQFAKGAKQISSNEPTAKLLSQAALQLCNYAAKQRWPLGYFSRVVGRSLALPDSIAQTSGSEAQSAQLSSSLCVPSGEWSNEVRFLSVLQTLDALADSSNVCEEMLAHHPPTIPSCPETYDFSVPESSFACHSSLSLKQWSLVARKLLKWVEQCTEHEHSHLVQEALPYIAYTLRLIFKHTSSIEQTTMHIDASSEKSLAAQIANDFSERLLAFITDSRSPALTWHTLSFVHMWPESYAQLAGLEGSVSWLLAALFDSENPTLLCELAWGSAGGRTRSPGFASRDQRESQVSGSAETQHHRSPAGGDGNASISQTAEAYMLCTSAGLVHAPWTPIVAVLSTLAERHDELRMELASRLDDLIDTLDGTPLLAVSELIAHCILLAAPLARAPLLDKLQHRTLALLDDYGYVGHMPTLFSVMQAVRAVLQLGYKIGHSSGEDLPRFVAWLSMESQAGQVAPFVETHFMRVIAGPWGRGECDALTSTLSILDTSAVDLLAHRAQAATSFAVRLAAEEQLALYGLRLPYLLANGCLAYPDAPSTEAMDSLVLVTRDIGLAMLVAGSGLIVPGALCILLRQVYSHSVCSPMVIGVCRQLLDSIAAFTGFSSASRMICNCAADIFCVDPELLDVAIEYLGAQITPEQDVQIRLAAALEWMLRGELTAALDAIPKPASRSTSSAISGTVWPADLFAHLLVLAVSNPGLFMRIRQDVLAPRAVSELLTRLVEDTPELVVVHILALCSSGKSMEADLNQWIEAMREKSSCELPVSLAFVRLSSSALKSRPLLQWGRRYSPQLVCSAIANVIKLHSGVSTGEFFSNARTAWMVIQLQMQFATAQRSERKHQLAGSLCCLIGLVLPDVLDSPLVQSVLIRAVVDVWQQQQKQRRAHSRALACLAICMLLDCSVSSATSSLMSAASIGMLDALPSEQKDKQYSLLLLISLLQAFVDSSGAAAIQDSSNKLLIGSELESLYDWARLSPLCITKGSIGLSDDRAMLASIAERAASLLRDAECSVAYAEILAESLERLVRLALPLSSDSNDPSLSNADARDVPRQIDLAPSVVAVLLRVRQRVLDHTCRVHRASHANGRATTLLLRGILLLQMIELPSDDSADAAVNNKTLLITEGDLSWQVCDVVTGSHNQSAVMAAISVAAELHGGSNSSESGNDSGLASADILHVLDSRQRWVLRDVSAMPAVKIDRTKYPAWLRSCTAEPPALDYALLESLCASDKAPSDAFSELVCALASHKECTKSKRSIPLVLADSRVASCMLPHVLHEILPAAEPRLRSEVASFLLDFAHNWRDRAPGMARDVIARTLDVRQLDQRYSDIREFFAHLPIPLFEMADLAARLGSPATAAFLLECDLTCTGAERLASINYISKEARELLRAVNKELGNQPAAQLLGSVGSIHDVLRRCHDTADWRTLLLYQEAAAATPYQHAGLPGGGEFAIGDTLVSLGLLNAMRPTLLGDGGPASSGMVGGAMASSSSQATYGASWRLAKWDVPTVPLALTACRQGPSMFLVRIERPEEAMYSMLRLRSNGQLTETAASVQEYMASARAVAAITERASSARESWSYRAVGVLLPLFLTTLLKTAPVDEFLHTSQIVSALLARSQGTMAAQDAEPIFQANLTLHEIAVCESIDNGGAGVGVRGSELVFSRYKEAVRLACVTARQARNWQSSMNHIFRLRHMAQLAKCMDKTLEPELKLWEAETLWEAGNRALAIEVLQSHKREIEKTLRQAHIEPSPYATRSGSGSRDGDITIDVASPAMQGWRRSEVDAATILMSRIILTVGEWSDHQRRERPAVLWEEYFNKSAQLLQEVNSPTVWTGRALHALAAFAERQCEELTSTRDNDSTIAVRKQKARELAACQQEISRTSTSAEILRLRGILRRLEIQVANDQNELDGLRASIGGFLRLAIWSFVKCLGCTDTFDNDIYSLVSLIMTNARASELQRVLSSGLMDSVPSHKFIPLVHQLCARLSTEEDAFHQTITLLVSRMAIDYPFHTMYHLFALRNANRALSSSAKESRKNSLGSLQLQESEKMEQRRSDAATAILTSVSSQSSDLHSIAQSINELCSSYIDLAVCPAPEKFKGGRLEDKLIPFNSRTRISRLIKNLPPNIPVLTATPRADSPRDYMCVPFISSITEGYSLAGGINLPKITRLVGTDGRRYKQLVKGKDDMRQDAVIQQLFYVINRFLGSAGAKARGLAASTACSSMRIRTYQVVPLTKRCGVLQWVDNTIPFGAWFQGREKRYRPAAPSMSQQRATIHEVHKDKTASAQKKLEIFEHVCSLAPPVFRFFFYEQFHNAQGWFERREMYIRSAAASSIAGWVLGIGDRHLQNILVDRTTAELVHIDLGIAFDMGKLLPIPELVPFRLTREVIDGMGLLGLDGTFRHSCQAALQAMRDNARVVITILNVLKVDPLYMWSLIPLRLDKMNRNVSMYVDELREHARAVSTSGDQNGGDYLLDQETDAAAAAEEENKEAGRSILHVGQRLSATISVEGQVSELIQQATDSGLLSRLFEGWSAWY